MTSTMSQTISSRKRDKAAKMAREKKENIAIILGEINGEKIQMLDVVSAVENSERYIEVIAVIDKDGRYVD